MTTADPGLQFTQAARRPPDEMLWPPLSLEAMDTTVLRFTVLSGPDDSGFPAPIACLGTSLGDRASCSSEKGKYSMGSCLDTLPQWPLSLSKSRAGSIDFSVSQLGAFFL